jgi:hypothetical protein
VLSTTTIFEKYQTTDFWFFLASSLCKSNHSEVWHFFLLKVGVVGIIWIKWSFSWSIGNRYYFASFKRVCIFLWWPISLLILQNFIAHYRIIFGLLMIYLKYNSLSSFICLPYLKWWTGVFIIFAVGFWWLKVHWIFINKFGSGFITPIIIF